MGAVQQIQVAAAEAELRLDRWFRQHFPELGHGRLEKLLRTGQIRIDGKRAKAGQRLEPGQTVRVPPLGEPDAAAEKPWAPAPPAMTPGEAAELQRRVLYRDDDVIAIDKPPGLAVQGGTGTVRHLDAMLDALRFGSAERPRLVHRLDRDTSGVLLLARGAASARALTAAFRSRSARKVYWAVVAGVPKIARGTIDLALAKRAGGAARGGELVEPDEEDGRPAITDYRVVEHAGKRAAWLALWPRTGRTHQLRAHCAALGTPILGDVKYGGADAVLPGAEIDRRLHLHARRIVLPHPRPESGRRIIEVAAPLPPHMAETWRYFGFDPAVRVAEEGPDD